MSNKTPLLSFALLVSGVAFCSLPVLSTIWPSGWAWHEGPLTSNNYYMMIIGVYTTLGIFLLLAARDPLANASLVWFTVFSSVVHALVMAWEAIDHPMHEGHLIGDIPALLLIAAALALLMTQAQNSSATTPV